MCLFTCACYTQSERVLNAASGRERRGDTDTHTQQRPSSSSGVVVRPERRPPPSRLRAAPAPVRGRRTKSEATRTRKRRRVEQNVFGPSFVPETAAGNARERGKEINISGILQTVLN